MKITLPSVLSLICLVYGNAEEVLPKAVLTTQSRTIPRGGRVTLTCSVLGSDDLKYEWLQRSSATSAYQPLKGYASATATVSDGGDYICQGWRKNSSTPQSDPVTILRTVSTVATVTQEPRWTPIFTGESITLTCQLRGGGDSQWKYEWKAPNLKKPPGNKMFTINRVTTSHGGKYSCRAKTSYNITEWSRSLKLDVSSNVPRASLQADRTEVAAGVNVTLTCSVSESEGWRYFLFMNSPRPSVFNPLQYAEKHTVSISEGGIYVCRGERGRQSFQSGNSPAVTVRKTDAAVILTSPVHPVTEGLSVSLSCELETGEKPSRVFFYQNEQVIQNDSRVDLNISAVSKSHQGFYKCEYHGRVSPQRWMEVVARNDSFPVVLVAGLVCGFAIILLLSLCWLRQSKVQSLLSADDSSVAQSTVNQTEAHVYASLRYGDTCVYESLRGARDTGSDGPTNEYGNITTLGSDKMETRDNTDERSDYVNVNPYEATGVWSDFHD